MLLSICIPTHNGRAGTLKQAVDSILAQVLGRHEDEIEICISDNGSEDGTQALVADYKRRHPGLFVTHRFETNTSFRNFLKVVEIASGEYCWLFGSDDALIPGALDNLLDILRRNQGSPGMTFGWLGYDRSMRYEVGDWFLKFAPTHRGEYAFSTGRCALACVGMHLMFMSGHVFRREFWLEVVSQEGAEAIMLHRHFSFAYILARIVYQHEGWIFSVHRFVKYRSDNYSLVEELGQGWSGYRIETSEDITGVFAAVLGSSSPEYRILLRNHFLNWFSCANIVNLKLSAKHDRTADIHFLISMTRRHWILPGFVFRALPMLLVSESVYKTIGRLTAAIRSIPMRLAPRTRIRAFLRARGIENGWTLRYDLHVANALKLAEEYRNRMMEQELDGVVTLASGESSASGPPPSHSALRSPETTAECNAPAQKGHTGKSQNADAMVAHAE